ncbi:hypothetical protein NDU88_002068 [Pleurodeles waltl]|uniref:Uncharacterized protein n=1 Tax=Pleurodeles waltl TaxID=8319 RepID=A0AAV7M139_PLEWA|nr:hypothetical protein NDU88_002068 [Pleurodeles waltl]
MSCTGTLNHIESGELVRLTSTNCHAWGEERMTTASGGQTRPVGLWRPKEKKLSVPTDEERPSDASLGTRCNRCALIGVWAPPHRQCRVARPAAVAILARSALAKDNETATQFVLV